MVKLTKLDQNEQFKTKWQAATRGNGKIDIWVAGELRKGLEVRPSRESNVINISYRAPDPAMAALLANAYAQAYVDTTIELRGHVTR